MKYALFGFATAAFLLLAGCNEMPMAEDEHQRGPAPYSADPTAYLPRQNDSENPLHGPGRY